MGASFWPIPLKDIIPPVRQTAHCSGYGFDSNNQKYALKFNDRFPGLTATEALCHGVARYCKIPVPDWSVVRHHLDGRLGFGSNWLPDAVPEQSARWVQFWRSAECEAHASFFSMTCALDAFLFNPDRHLQNFLVTSSAVLARPCSGDFGHAWWMARWHPDALLPEETNSVDTYRYLFKRMPFDVSAALHTLEQLGQLQPRRLGQELDLQPDQWLEFERLESLLHWSATGGLFGRANMLMSRMTDGNLPL